MSRLVMSVESNTDYFEVRWAGDVPDILPMPSPYDSMPDGSRVLVDATALTGADAPALRWSAVASRAVERGLKIAVVSPPGLIFGLYRLALHAAGIDEEHAVALFHGREEALQWLLADGEGASRFRP